MTAEIIKEPELVKAIENMSTENFALHMENRHPESLAGLPVLWFSSDYVEECYRAFHRQLHKFRPNLAHYHEEQ